MTGRRRSRTDGASSAPRAARVLDAKAARLAAGDLLSRRAWTEVELTRRLTRRGAPRDVAVAIVADLVGRGYVDDAALARHFVETRVVRGYGAARIAADLRARGVVVARAGGRSDAALHERRHGAVQACLPRRGAARLRPGQQLAEVRAGGRQAQRPRERGADGAPPHVLRDARQLLVRRLLQGTGD